MLELTRLRQDRDQVIAGLAKRGIDPQRIDEVLELDAQRRALQTEVDQVQSQLNAMSDSIGRLMREGKKDEAAEAKEKVNALKSSMEPLQERYQQAKNALDEALIALPNVPHSSVPNGKTAEDNEVYRQASIPAQVLPEGAKAHWDLGVEYKLFDLELGVKLTGAGFPVYRGYGARLQRGLISMFLDRAIAAGYEEYMPPLMVNADSAMGTGQLPDKEGQMYFVTEDKFYLIPTAEVPVTNVYRDSILETKSLPIKMCGYTPCFRREAGSYGKDVRGLNRLHQFDKVEIVRIEHPNQSYAALEEMLGHVASLLDELELRYRILRLCGGDMGFASALTYDFEVWSPGQDRWLEVSSVSNFETFQSNRLALRIREGKEKQLAHTLNGSALALPRIVAGLLETHQTAEGIRIPKALAPYCGFDFIPKPN